MAGFAPGLAPLAARPPTPPKDNTAKASPSNGLGTTSRGHALLDTPDESPSSSADYTKDSNGKIQKKVGFTLLGTQYHRFSVDGHESDSDGQMRKLPRSRDCKSAKSILKACTDYAGEPLNNDLLGFDHANLPAMLRSTTQHLASASRSSRIDAYSTLIACLSAYDEIPEVQGLAEKVAEITGYIRRDVTATKEEDGSLDIQLATQALKMTTIFLYTPSITTMFPEDFCSFILERSISSLDDQACPKILASHYMQLLEKQRFSPKCMTTDRVARLFSALDTVTTRVTGNRVIVHRLMIYHRLLGQAKSSMISRVASWIDHLVSGMLSTIKDVRARAIAFGMDASLQLGTTSSVSQACLELFDRSSADGRKVVNFLCSRLLEMANSKEDGIHVPQIWSVVIMFLRGRRRQLENWEHMKAWLVVIQRCFNSSDGQTKLQANIAWNRLIFAINLDTSTSVSMAKMLRQPIVSPLERRSSDKNSRIAKQIARSSYCTLLYYALRPTATHAQLDQYWNLYVYQILPSCFTASKNDVDYACNILSALFSGTGKAKIWEDSRTNDGPINPEDLLCLDPKWTRLRTADIMLVFDKLFDTADWRISVDEDAPIVLAWRSFTSALGNAGGKEVIVSMEAMNAVAHIINGIKLLLQRSNSELVKQRNALQRHTTSKVDQSKTFEKVTILIKEAVARIGVIPFLERRLIRTSQDSYEAADTPSSRSSRDSGSLNSPIVHLLNVLLKNVQEMSDATSYLGALKIASSISLQSAASRRTQLSILRNLGRLLVSDDVRQQEVSIMFWRLLAESTSSALKQPHEQESHNDSPQLPGHDFREAVKILELGIQFRSSGSISTWRELHADIVDALRKDIGEEAISLVIVEPLAGILSKDDCIRDDFVLAAATFMVEAIRWPQSLNSMERIQRQLWGVNHIAPKVTSPNLHDKLYSMVEILLGSSYDSLEVLPPASIIPFIRATIKMIVSCPPEYMGMALFRMKKGLAPWVEDTKGILSMRLPSPLCILAPEVKQLWLKVVKSIEQSTVFDTRYLLSIQELVVAGFRSRHKAVVNETIIMWNRTFGGEGALEYPEDLRAILQKLRYMTDLRLPNFPDSIGDDVIHSPLHFVDSQDEEEAQSQPVVSSHRFPGSIHSLQSVSGSIKSAPLSPGPRKAATPQSSSTPSRRKVKTTPRVRLRHDDSQVQFAAIESSPLLPEPVDSQCLTAHQKEVKERQGREAAAMFPEIGSSPRSTSRPLDYVLPKLVLKSSQDAASKSALDEDTSPYLPDAFMNEFLGSSPTPSSKRSSERRSDDDPPSSPPFVPSNLPFNQSADAPLANEPPASAGVTAAAENHPRNHIANENIPSGNDFQSGDEVISAIQDNRRPKNNSGDASHLEAPQEDVDVHPTSELDIYVDAPSVPSPTIPSTEHDDDMPNDIAVSIQSEGPLHFSTEDEQPSTQLWMEMEQASQRSTDQDQTVQPSQGTGRKRKRAVDSAKEETQTKRTAASFVSQAAADIPVTETVADCVMIDVRAVSPWQIKREPSASPPISGSIQAIEETPVAEKAPATNLKNSKADQSSSYEKDTPMTAKQAIGRNSQIKEEEIEKDQSSASRKSMRVAERLSGSTSNSPDMSPPASQGSAKGGQWLKLGKTPRKGMFRWLQRGSAESEELGPSKPAASSTNEGNTEDTSEPFRAQASQRDDRSSAYQLSERQRTSHNEDGASGVSQRDDPQATPKMGQVSGRGRDGIEAPGILENLRDTLESIKGVRLGPEEERAAVGILFECVKEVHEAGRRHTAM